jgi:hypothetical protein
MFEIILLNLSKLEVILLYLEILNLGVVKVNEQFKPCWSSWVIWRSCFSPVMFKIILLNLSKLEVILLNLEVMILDLGLLKVSEQFNLAGQAG